MKRLLGLLAILGLAAQLNAEQTLPVNTAVVVQLNVVPLTDDTDFKSIEASVVYNQSGLDLNWVFRPATGAIPTKTAVTPTNTGGDYDFTSLGDGLYVIEIPATGGASINNNTEGCGYFEGFATGVLPWIGPEYCFTQVPAATVARGTAQSATGTTIVLASASAFANDELNGNLIRIISGTGKGQTRQIDDYVSSTDTATVSTWTTNPDSTSVYEIVAFPVLQTAATFSAALLDADVTTHTTASTVGQRFNRIPNATAGAAGGMATADNVLNTLAVKRATGFDWPFQMFNATTGLVMTSGTPVCTRALDNRTFGGTPTETAIDANGLAVVTLSAGDMTANTFVILKCTLSLARDYYQTFKVQVP
jgi:hypothetical protein